MLSVFTHRDYTDNDLDGGEVENASRSRSSPPIPSVTRCLDAHFGQDQLAIESTGKSLSFCLPVSLFTFLLGPLSRCRSSPAPCPCARFVLHQMPALGGFWCEQRRLVCLVLTSSDLKRVVPASGLEGWPK